MPLATKSSAGIAGHFLQQVLARFGACSEVVTDQGREFLGEFRQLLLTCGIRPRQTAAYHPQSNGLTERAVQTIKRGLRKFAEEQEKRDWDLELPWLLMGYRFSAQESLGVSPYYILFGRQPVLPVGCPVWLEQPLQAEDSDSWLRLCQAKARFFKEMMPTALDNLQAAQDRDARRHAQRVGEGQLQTPVLQVGEQVWLRRQKQDTLDTGWSAEKWIVLEVRASGIVKLKNALGEELSVRREQCYKVAPRPGLQVSIEGSRSNDRKGAEHSPGRATCNPGAAPESPKEVVVYSRRRRQANVGTQ